MLGKTYNLCCFLNRYFKGTGARFSKRANTHSTSSMPGKALSTLYELILFFKSPMRKVLSLSFVKGEETEAQRGLSNLPGVTYLVSEGARTWALAVWLWNPWTSTLYRLKETGRGHAWQSTARLLTTHQSRAGTCYLLGAAPIPSTDSATRHVLWRNLPALCGGYQQYQQLCKVPLASQGSPIPLEQFYFVVWYSDPSIHSLSFRSDHLSLHYFLKMLYCSLKARGPP